MKKLFKYISLLLLPLMITIGFSSWIIIGEKTVTVGQKDVPSVCYNNVTNKIYTSLEKGLEEAKSGETIYVYTGRKDIVIKNNCEIKSGVSLVLPYTYENGEPKWDGRKTGQLPDDWALQGSWDTQFADETEELVKQNLKINITLESNVELSVNGSLYIGGIVGDEKQRPSAQTSYDYTQITLKPNSKIIVDNGGIVECMGYVKEDYTGLDYNGQSFEDTKKGNGSVLEIKNGTLKLPYVIYDYYGGGNTIGCYKAGGIFPFYVFDMPNVQSKLIAHRADSYCAKIVGYADLFTAQFSANVPLLGEVKLPAQHNNTEATILYSESSLIELKNNTVFISKYSSYDSRYTSSSRKENCAKTYINISGGGASLGSLDMLVKVLTMEETVSSSTVFFPLSYKLDITLESGNYVFGNKIKSLPGSVLRVGENASLDVTSEYIIYDTQSFTNACDYDELISEKGAASFTVDGILNISENGKIGGLVKTSKDGAKININCYSTSNLSVSSMEGIGGGPDMSNILDTYNKGTFTGEPYIKSFTGYTGEDVISNFKISRFISKNGVWEELKRNINYYSVYSDNDTIEELTNHSNITYRMYSEGSFTLSTPSNGEYNFIGWYYDAAHKNIVENGVISVSTLFDSNIMEPLNIYALWDKGDVFHVRYFDYFGNSIESYNHKVVVGTTNITLKDSSGIENKGFVNGDEIYRVHTFTSWAITVNDSSDVTIKDVGETFDTSNIDSESIINIKMKSSYIDYYKITVTDSGSCINGTINYPKDSYNPNGFTYVAANQTITVKIRAPRKTTKYAYYTPTNGATPQSKSVTGGSFLPKTDTFTITTEASPASITTQ